MSNCLASLFFLSFISNLEVSDFFLAFPLPPTVVPTSWCSPIFCGHPYPHFLAIVWSRSPAPSQLGSSGPLGGKVSLPWFGHAVCPVVSSGKNHIILTVRGELRGVPVQTLYFTDEKAEGKIREGISPTSCTQQASWDKGL